MDQSGKVLLYSSVALSLAVLLGLSALLARHDASWSRLAPIAALMPPPPDPVVVAATEMAQLVAGPLPDATGGGATDATPPPDHWSEAEVAAGLMECVRLLGPRSAEVISLAPIRTADCGTPAPVLLRSLGDKDKVMVDPPHPHQLPHGGGAQPLDGRDGATGSARRARRAGVADHRLRLCLPQPLQPSQCAAQPTRLRRRCRSSGVSARRRPQGRSDPGLGPDPARPRRRRSEVGADRRQGARA